MSSTAAYRQLLRQLVYRASPAADKARFKAHIRAMFTSATEENVDSLRVAAANAALFLKAQRTHKELLVRYNPTTDMTTAEHVAATAHRVGLRLTDEGKK